MASAVPAAVYDASVQVDAAPVVEDGGREMLDKSLVADVTEEGFGLRACGADGSDGFGWLP